MTIQLSERAKQLIPKARIVSFASWQELQPQELIQIFQQADDEGRYLSESDLQKVKTFSSNTSNTSTLLDIVNFLRDNAPEIVAVAREKVLAEYPDITKPGGDLYPPERAEACWRDFWHFFALYYLWNCWSKYSIY